MLQTILNYLPVLAVAIVVNIILGLYSSIGSSHNAFDWRKLVNGVLKALCVASAFIGLAYCFDATGTSIDLGVLDINPELIITSSIVLYTGKGLANLAKIFGLSKE